MSWATDHIARLTQGETVSFRPHGYSMQPRIQSGQWVTVAPITRPVVVDDVVLCTVAGRQVLHLVRAIQGQGDAQRFQIGNHHGKINGWVPRQKIHGVLIALGDTP